MAGAEAEEASVEVAQRIEMPQAEHVRFDYGLQFGMLHRKRLARNGDYTVHFGRSDQRRSTPSPTIPVAPMFFFATEGLHTDLPSAKVLLKRLRILVNQFARE